MLARTGDGLPTTHGELAGHARALIEQAEADFEKRHEATTLRDWLSSQGRSRRRLPIIEVDLAPTARGHGGSDDRFNRGRRVSMVQRISAGRAAAQDRKSDV